MGLEGSALGSVLAGAVGAPAAAGGFFATLGGVIKSWALEHLQVQPGAMAATGGAVAGIGSFSAINTSAQELGTSFADALTIPATAIDARVKWIETAQALIDHFENFGQANGTGLLSGSPCVGAGTIQFSSAVFVPLLSQRLSVTDLVAAAALDAFGAMLISYIQTNGTVVSLSLTGPPLTAPSDGPVTGTGTIA